MLKGTLDDFTLADIFRLMSLARRTGKLEVVRSAGRGKVFVREGEVYYAESSLIREPLGQKLIRLGALTEGALMKALDENAASGKRVGEILVENGSISYEQLQKALQQQIEDAVFDLLRWDLGDFTWEPGVIAEVEVNIGVSVENLIIEASRRLDELEVIGRKIPSVDSLLKMANTPPEGAAEINITPEEWRMLVLVDGSRSVHEIGVQVGVDDLTALRSLYGLVSAGLVEVEEGRDSIDAAGRPGEQVRDFSRRDEEEAQSDSPDASAGSLPSEADLADIVSQVVPDEDAVEPMAEQTEDGIAEPAVAEVPVAEEHPASVEPQGDDVPVFDEPEAQEMPVIDEPVAQDEPAIADINDLGGFGDFGLEPASDPVAASENQVSEEDGQTEPAASFEAEGSSDGEPDGAAPLEDSVPAVDQFDSPAEDELVSVAPSDPTEGDPFLTDLLAGGPGAIPEPQPTASEEPPSPVADVQEEASSSEGGDAPSVDRASVVRELAGLFDDDRPRVKRQQADAGDAKEGSKPPAEPRRVEDDDQLNKGLIGRLIDGVKGL